MEEYSMTINGQSTRGNHHFEVINPATEEIIATVPECSDEQLEMALDAATRALTAWRGDITKRRQALNKCADVLLSNVDSLAKMLTEEQENRSVTQTEKSRGRRSLLRSSLYG